MRVNTLFITNGLEELKIKYKDSEDALLALADVEHMVNQIDEEVTNRAVRENLKRLNCVPEIPDEKEYWGKKYTSKCVCGGTITAIRSTLNGHIRAKCDKCGWNMIE